LKWLAFRMGFETKVIGFLINVLKIASSNPSVLIRLVLFKDVSYIHIPSFLYLLRKWSISGFHYPPIVHCPIV
jgi:hypothetical protein